jgi:hypothetical protein
MKAQRFIVYLVFVLVITYLSFHVQGLLQKELDKQFVVIRMSSAFKHIIIENLDKKAASIRCTISLSKINQIKNE